MPQREGQIAPARPVDSVAVARLAQALTDPLNGVLALGELLQRQPLSEAARAQVSAMLDAGRRMTGILCDAIETRDIAAPPSPAPTALRELVDDVEAGWRSRIREDAAQFLMSCNAAADLKIMIDAGRMRQLLNALIQDAVHARAWGVVELQLSVTLEPGGMAAVHGRLDAPGTDAAACDPVALDLCQAIVRQMGGDLSRTQGIGPGVRTIFSFQALQAGCDETQEMDSEEADGPLPPRTHLLIVDDNATNRIVAAALCEMFGCTSETVEDGLEAVEAVQSRHFDLILMDIRMPRMDGLTATKVIRGLGTAAAQTPIVALTANADPEAVASYLAGGMQGVVDKPIKPEQLLSTLQAVLYGRNETMTVQSSAA